ncbi:hypothetical protein ES695_08525 [Candidatus Atribacteria bacterium 1244-E10-H5-B2]|nr:MAG: hypothetical protein ES695_08525 [Candidatus Atribacteria bacterium 1244-E10-H5-B2]
MKCYSRLLCVIGICLIIIALTGCYPSKLFLGEYQVEPPVFAKPLSDATLKINACKDNRKSLKNSTNAIFLIFIPFVPYATDHIQSPEKFVGTLFTVEEYSITRDLTMAVVNDLKQSNIFANVTGTLSLKPTDYDYILSLKLNKATWHRSLTWYGLSVAGDILWILGLPCSYGNVELEIGFSLIDAKSEKEIWVKSYKETESVIEGEYYNFNTNGRWGPPFKRIMKNLRKDLAECLKKRK